MIIMTLSRTPVRHLGSLTTEQQKLKSGLGSAANTFISIKINIDVSASSAEVAGVRWRYQAEIVLIGNQLLLWNIR